LIKYESRGITNLPSKDESSLVNSLHVAHLYFKSIALLLEVHKSISICFTLDLQVYHFLNLAGTPHITEASVLSFSQQISCNHSELILVRVEENVTRDADILSIPECYILEIY
jgi:hypothetical protein